jgi:hypothetical protein
MNVWVCDDCEHAEPASSKYEVGSSEPCVFCVNGLATVESHPGIDCFPLCQHCSIKPPHFATCFGAYEGLPEAFACNECCGHGCEDGHCTQVTVDNVVALVKTYAVADTTRRIMRKKSN